MKIEVFGTGCPKCGKLMEIAKKAVKELGTEAEVVKVEDMNEIMKRGIMMLPALAINGETKSSGRMPGVGEIKKWLQEK